MLVTFRLTIDRCFFRLVDFIGPCRPRSATLHDFYNLLVPDSRQIS